MPLDRFDSPGSLMPLTSPPIELYLDLTTSTHAAGRSAGSTRVEWQFARHVTAAAPGPVHAVSWSSSANDFVRLPSDLLRRSADRPSDGLGLPATARRIEVAPDGPDRRRILLVTGAGWLSNASVLHATRRLRARLGAELFTVIHDVVHLQCPHWFDRQSAARLGANMTAMLASANVLLVYSRSTAADIDAVATRLAIPRRPTQTIALGADLPPTGAGTDVSPARLGIPAHRPFVLYVSTITFRKNHAFLYNVWRRLAEELGDTLPTLVCVGHVAEDQLEFVDRVRRDRRAADHVRFLSGLDDAMLGSLYRQCAFTVFPSLYEGWGLPAAESLAHGKVCVASNASSLPEVTGDCGVLLDPYDHAAWCATVKDLVTHPERVRALEAAIHERYRPTTWQSAATRLLEVLASVAPSDAPREQSCAARDSAIGWRLVARERLLDEPGRRNGDRATSWERLGVLLDSVPPHGLRLWLSVRALGTGTPHVQVDVSGMPIDAWPIAPSPTAVARPLDVPATVVRQYGLLDIEVRSVADASVDANAAAAIVIEGLRLEPLSADEGAALDLRQRMLWAPDTPLTFGHTGRGQSILAEGWGEPAPWGVWSVAPEALLRFVPVTRGVRAMYLRAVVRAFVWPAAPTLDVDVLVDDEPVGRWTFLTSADRERAERQVVIPWRPQARDALTVTFRMPGCRSPRDLGLGSDVRRLGLGLIRAVWSLSPPEGSDA
jgi:glycosyltransferase involved in cell wall biosynthesis